MLREGNLPEAARRVIWRSMNPAATRLGLLGAALAAGVALGGALAAETFLGVVPCALCLIERWPYRIAIGVALIGLLLPRLPGRVALALAGLIVLGGGVVAAVHVGVEAKLWPSPLPECAAPHFSGGSIADRLASMPARPSKPCDEPTYMVPGLPLSTAALNLIYALAYGVGVGFWLWRTRRPSA